MITRSKRGPAKENEDQCTGSTTNVPVRRIKRQRMASLPRGAKETDQCTGSARVPGAERQRMAPAPPPQVPVTIAAIPPAAQPQVPVTIAAIPPPPSPPPPPPPPPIVPVTIVAPKTPACGKDALYWKSNNAAKLFGFTLGDDVFQGLGERIRLLRKGNASPDGWKCLVRNDDDNILDLYTDDDILELRHKCLFLSKAYSLALKHCFVKSFSKCVEQTTTEMKELGLVGSQKKVCDWNADFRSDQVFSHPSRLLKTPPKPPHLQLLDHFPCLRDMFTEFSYTHKGIWTGNTIRTEVVSRMLPACKRQSELKGCFNDGSKGQQILQTYLEKPPTQRVLRKLIRHLEIEWDFWCTIRGTAKIEGMVEAWAEGKYTGLNAKKSSDEEEVPLYDDKHDAAAADNNNNNNIYRNLLARTEIKSTPAERLKQLWADGVYANRRPKGKGLRNAKKASDMEEVLSDGDNNDVDEGTCPILMATTTTTTNL